MLKKLKRVWCKLMHSEIMFAGGRTYQCRKCLERFEHPALDGPQSCHPAKRLMEHIELDERLFQVTAK